MSLTCYIIDDEPLAIEVLESHIEKYGHLKISGTFLNAVKAFQALQEKPVDLLFLDIRMPKLSGIEFLRTLKHPPKVILTTAYREYAVEGFELDVVDYLLKPISFERFLKAMGKVMQHEGTIVSPAGKEDEPEDIYLFVHTNNKMLRIAPGEILYIESQRDYVNIVSSSRELQVRQKISELEEKLRPSGFLRIHRSFIISLDKVESWSASEIEVGGFTLPVGRTYKNEVLKVLEKRSDVL